MLFYLIKHSCPDITNSVHESSKVLDRAYPTVFKEMLCVIKFILDTKNYGLKFVLNLDKHAIWDFICYSDSDYAGDPDSHQIVSIYIL